ncbi:MAG: hypothetical protein LBR00_05130 [Clostridiales Family XIII bacterium]|jgi:hypothetical protein|nr:hypothetical protein [Clostridiales Family XIII bacterium]
MGAKHILGTLVYFLLGTFALFAAYGLVLAEARVAGVAPASVYGGICAAGLLGSLAFKFHVASLLKKTECRNRAELVALFVAQRQDA